MSPLVIAESPYGHEEEQSAPATNRTTLLLWSTITTSLPASTATPDGWLSSALVAGPESPEYPCVPLPATVEIVHPDANAAGAPTSPIATPTATPTNHERRPAHTPQHPPPPPQPPPTHQ